MGDTGEPAAGAQVPAGPTFLLGGWTVQVDLDRLVRGPRAVHIEPKHMDVLVLLAESPGRVLSKDDILSRVWQDQFVAESVLTRAIAELRRTLGDDARNPRFIETIPRRGYRLVAPVDRSAPPARVVPEARPAPKPTEDRHRPRRRRLAWPLLALGLMAAAAIGWAALRQLDESPATPVAPVDAVAGAAVGGHLRLRHITASPEIEAFPSLSPDGSSLVYSSNRSGSFEIYLRQLIPGGREIQLTSDGMSNVQPAWSPDGSLLAYHSQRRGGIWVLPSLGGQPRQLTSFGSNPDWSPHGRSLVFQRERLLVVGGLAALPPSTLWLVPAEGSTPRQLTRIGEPPGGHGAPAFSPDGERVVFASTDLGIGGLWTISVSGDDLRQVVKDHGGDPEFSSDGESIFFAGFSQADKWLFRVSAGQRQAPAVPERLLRLPARHLSMSADGRHLVFSRLSFTSNIWSIPISPDTAEAAGEPRPLTRETQTRIALPAISPDGQRIAFSITRTGALPEAWMADRDEGELTQLVAGSTIAGAWPSWSRDGRHLYFRSGRRWHRIELASRRIEALTQVGSDWQYPRLSPDARKVVFYRTLGGVSNIWTAGVDGSRLTQLTFDQVTANFPSWSQDGAFVAFELEQGPDTQVAVVPAAGGPVTQLTFDPGESWSYSFSPDGDKVFFAGRRDAVWNVYWVSRTDGRVHRLTDHVGGLGTFVRYPACSPTGDLVAYEMRETTSDIWMIDLP